MANTLTNIMDRTLAAGLLQFRSNAAFLLSANRNYSDEAKQKGTTIDIPKSRARTAQDVVPSGNRPDALPDTTQDLVQITLDQWKFDSFSLTDKEVVEFNANRHFIPMESAETVNALVENAEDFMAGLYTEIYNWTGTPSTTPFQTDASASIQINKILNDNKVSKMERRLIMDTSAEAEALGLSVFADAEKTMENGVKIDAALGQKYGMFNVASTSVKTHITAAAGTIITDGVPVVGATTINVDGLTTKPEAGDLWTKAGDTQQYTVVSSTTLAGTASTLTISPPIAIAGADGALLTFIADHVANVAFQKNAISFAQRPLAGSATDANIRSLTDSLTGITLRLEVDRAHKADVWAMDMLFGGKVVEPKAAVRLLG